MSLKKEFYNSVTLTNRHFIAFRKYSIKEQDIKPGAITSTTTPRQMEIFEDFFN